jgi:phosphoribosylanthranilate isomerase
MKAGCKVKICGTTSIEDAWLAAREGADYVGVVVEVDFSPRSLTIEGAREIFAAFPGPAVALVYQMPWPRLCMLIDSLKPAAVQFLNPAADLLTRCKELFPGIQLWQSIHLPPENEPGDGPAVRHLLRDCIAAGADVIIFDTAAVIGGTARFGGTGCRSDWRLVRELVRDCPVPAFLAGGINPANVGEAIRMVKPAGIDLCSGVEILPGKKSAGKIRALMEAVQGKGNDS